MDQARSMLLSSPSLALSSHREFEFSTNEASHSLTIYRATAVDGGFTVTVPMAPKGTAPISGQTYAVLTGCNTTVTDDTVAAGPAVFEVGPL